LILNIFIFQLTRVAMTMEKAEVQSLKKVGTDLREERFSHKWLAQTLFLQKALLVSAGKKIDVVYEEVPC
jgi:hypothetical protein